MALPVPHRQVIGGDWVTALDGEAFDVYDPSTGQQIAEVPKAKEADVDRAVEAARKAFAEWRRVAPAERGRLCFAAAAKLRELVDELAQIGSLDGGLPLPAVARDVEAAARYFEYYGGLADKVDGEIVPLGDEYLDYTRRQPWGVCAVVVPFNSPFQILARSAAPALAAGNVVVAKASEQAPLGPLLLAQALEQAGFPPGAINVVTGFGEAGARLVGHEGVDRVTFTGSEQTGRLVLEAANRNFTPVTLELGGKSPQLVFADADLEVAAQTIVASLVWSAGQVCSAGTRVLIERSAKDQIVEAIVAQMSATQIGRAVDSPEMGPVIDDRQQTKVLGAIEDAQRGGAARLLTGGGVPEGVEPGGYYVAPTVFDVSDPGDPIVQEEIFGPVLSVMEFGSAAEAVELANSTRFGLMGSLWTRDVSRAHRVAAQLDCGQVFVNAYSAGTGIEIPFGGFKRSGIGREKGVAGFLEYTQIKNVCIKVDPE